jgi:hypothetical protein
VDVATTVACDFKTTPKSWTGYDLTEPINPGRKRFFWSYFGGRGKDRRDSDGKDKLHTGLDKWWKIKSFTGSVDPDLAIAMSPDKDFQALGSIVDFFFGSGWGNQEARYRWSNAKEAHLSFYLKEYDGRDLMLRFYGFPYLGGGKISKQDIGVFVNGQKVADWEINNKNWYEARIQSSLVRPDKPIHIALKISHPMSPIELGISKDNRRLGITLMKLGLNYAENK